jgi:two-component system cell cycle sensor histidine kinase/response regulator CckA
MEEQIRAPDPSRRSSGPSSSSEDKTIPALDALFRHMAATIQEVFWLSPPDLKTLWYASPAYERVWGQPWDAALQPPAAIVNSAHPDDFSRVYREISSVRESPRDIEYRIVRPDGAVRWVRNRVHAVCNEQGRVEMLAGAATDITEAKLFQKSLIESHARFVTVLDSIDADIYVADLKTHEILFANQHIRESFRKDLLGEKCWAVFRKETGPCSMCSNPRLFDSDSKPSGGVVWEGRNPVTGKWYLNYDRAIQWVDGRLVRIQIATDITRLKDLETESARIQAQLQQAQKMEAIGTLAGGIAHDFNNILAAVLGYTEIALMGVEDASAVSRNLQEVLRAGNRAREMVKQILTFSRQTEHEFKPAQLSLIVMEALNLIRASLPSTIRIHQRLNSPSAVMADPTQIHQVIINLCTNAAHAMREKGGELFVVLEDTAPDRSFFQQHPDLALGPYQRLTIRDTGSGIPAEVISRIFDPFFTTKQPGEGTGMGLAVVMGIIHGHKGAISVESTVGRGTAFHLLFPIVQAGEAQPSLELMRSLPSGGERILLIDDEEPLVELGKLMLEQLGYQVTTHVTGTDALETFRRDPYRFDLVITDMTMPGLTGDRLAQGLLVIRPDIPIILCTGYSNRMSKERAKAIGIRHFVLKPLVIGELARTVRNVLDGKAV